MRKESSENLDMIFGSIFSLKTIKAFKAKITEVIKTRSSKNLVLESLIPQESLKLNSLVQERKYMIFLIEFNYVNHLDFSVFITLKEYTDEYDSIKKLHGTSYMVKDKVKSFNKFLNSIISARQFSKFNNNEAYEIIQNIYEFSNELNQD